MTDLDQFDYKLPENLIAQYPSEHRGSSRLLILPKDNSSFLDLSIIDLKDRLRAGDLLILNDTKVIKARLPVKKADTYGKCEVFIEKCNSDGSAEVMIKSSKSPKISTIFLTENGVELEVLKRDGIYYHIRRLDGDSIYDLLEKEGNVPLPPYIRRPSDELDRDRYQTIYSSRPGAVAAPTAGLHFNEDLFDDFRARNIDYAMLTLHVGSGTFKPIRGNLSNHEMHCEEFEITKELVEKIIETKKSGGRIVAVGTTVVRALEAAAERDILMPIIGSTNLFIKPGFKFKVVDMVFTNFHQPKSTLFVLVSAFAGINRIHEAYTHAIRKHYKFLSYGDAMLIESRCL